MDSRSAKKKKGPLARPFVVTMAFGIPATIALIATGCGTGADPAAGGGGTSGGPPGGVDDGSCSNEGAQRDCHLNLGMKGDFQTCFQGTQTCTGGLWSPCGGDGTITNSLTPAGTGVSTAAIGGVHILAGPKCGDHVCNGTETCAHTPSVAGDCLKDCGQCPPGAGTAGVSICTQDPCNPSCLGWTGNPSGLTPTLGSAGVEVIGFGQIKNGMLQKLALDSCNGAQPCDDWTYWQTQSSYSNCQMDTYCSLKKLGGTGCCEQFDTLGTYGKESPPLSTFDNTGIGSTGNTAIGTPLPGAPDLTIGPGCSDQESDKYRYFPICNRGTAPVPLLTGGLPTVIRARYTTPVPNSGTNWPNNACTAGSCTTNDYDCSVVLDAAIFNGAAQAVNGGGSAILGTLDPVSGLLPGTCILMDTQAKNRAMASGTVTDCAQPNGDKWIKINCDNVSGVGGVNEGVLDPTAANGTPLAQPTTGDAINGCANNWTDHSPDNNPPACTGAKQTAFQVQYHATCPPGNTVVWNKLTYHTATPKDATGFSEIFFEAATAPEPASGPLDPSTFTDFVTLAEAKWTSWEGNTGSPTVSNGPPNANDNNHIGPGCINTCTLASNNMSKCCTSDPENCTAVNPATQNTYTWKTNTNQASPAAPDGDGLPAATTSNPSACPKDIETQFKRDVGVLPFDGLGASAGGIAARNPYLNLRMTLRPTPGNTQPTLTDWALSFQCVSNE